VDNLAFVIHSFVDLASKIARDKGRGLLKAEVEQVRPVAPRNLQDISEAARRDQSRLCSSSFSQCIDDNGRAVREKPDLYWREIGTRNSVHDAECQVFGNSVRLPSVNGTNGSRHWVVLAPSDIRECPPDISRYTEHGTSNTKIGMPVAAI